MTLKTRYNLWKMQKSLSPDSQFKAGLFKKLNLALDTAYGVKYGWHQTVWFKHAVGFASVVLVVGSLGASAYAYTNPEVTQGSVLYPIKEQLENIEEQVQITPEAKAKFYLKKIKRREEEEVFLREKTNVSFQGAQGRVSTDATATAHDFPQSISLNQKKIEKIEKSIEQTEVKLEQADKIIERVRPKNIENIKLRERVKERLQIRLEKRQAEQTDTTTEKNQPKDDKDIKLRQGVKEQFKLRLENKQIKLENQLQNLRSRIEFKSNNPACPPLAGINRGYLI